MRVLLLSLLVSALAKAQHPLTPDQVYGELFRDVQMSGIFPDSKTFVDCIPKRDPKAIVKDYKAVKSNPKLRFSLKLFVEENFIIPQTPHPELRNDPGLVKHIESLWIVLRRKADSAISGSSLLPLPYDYIVPGGRFREIYYWDSYFTMLGLKESGQDETIESMIKNFAFLIEKYGHIPNGNRTYYLSRSQPPFLSLMVDLLAEIKGKEVYFTYLAALEKEYRYWMDKTAKTKHVVSMPDGSLLNRYWDQLNTPRQESYLEDIDVAKQKQLKKKHETTLYRHLRSAAESGWDFSSRWFAVADDMTTIRTTEYVPVDLNCLLYHLERTIAFAYREKYKLDSQSQFNKKATQFENLAEKRKQSILKYCWSSEEQWFVDYHLPSRQPSKSLTLAGMFPYFFNLPDSSQLRLSKKVLEEKFLKAGGVVTTLISTGQQWDAPNGWAPLQWITIQALENYGEKNLAKEIAQRWYALNKRVFDATGKLMEKYDVEHANREGGGGEYPSQDGFGWTNGVLLALIKQYNLQ